MTMRPEYTRAGSTPFSQLPGPEQLELPGLSEHEGPEISRANRERLLHLAARIRKAARAKMVPTAIRRLDVAYVLCARFDTHHDRFAWCVLGPSGSVGWLTSRLIDGVRTEQRFPFALWGRTPVWPQTCELTVAGDQDPLPEFTMSAYVSADPRLGSTVLRGVFPASNARAIVLFSARPVPGWPE
jgi:hypothetical protein